jgi:hypothetical protein
MSPRAGGLVGLTGRWFHYPLVANGEHTATRGRRGHAGAAEFSGYSYKVRASVGLYRASPSTNVLSPSGTATGRIVSRATITWTKKPSAQAASSSLRNRPTS